MGTIAAVKKLRTALAVAIFAMLGTMSGSAATFELFNNLFDDAGNPQLNGVPESTSFAGSANGLHSFGSYVTPLDGSIYTATVALSNYAKEAQYSGSGTGYNVGVTLSLFKPGTLTSGDPAANNAVYTGNTLVAQSSTNAFITWLAAGDTTGQINLVDFSFAGVPLSGDYIWSVSFDTDYTTLNNPANDLHWALNTTGPNPGSSPQFLTNYLDGVGNNVGLTNASGFVDDWGTIGQGEIGFGTPEPATFGLIGFGLAGLGFVARKSRSRA